MEKLLSILRLALVCLAAGGASASTRLGDIAWQSDVTALNSAVATINAYLAGEDARLTITNYYGSTANPHLYIEQKITEGGTNYWKKVWDETTRWDAFLTCWTSFTNAAMRAIEEKADRAWGFYDSHTGQWSPENYTQVSSSNILIAAGMGYQKTVTSYGEAWVLTANEPYTSSGVTSNGFFRISDAEGNIQFEIVKGDKVTLPAQAGGVTVGAGSPQPITVLYPVATQPKASVSLYLEGGGDWHDEDDDGCPATVVWSGSPGAYSVTITPTIATTRIFVKASYEVGGETYINQRAPSSLSGGIILNNIKYMPVVNGTKLEFVRQ